MAYFLSLKTTPNSGYDLSLIKDTLPFEVKRVYKISPQPNNGHTHGVSYQALLCIKGEVSIIADSNSYKKKFRLTKNNKFLIIEPNDWHQIQKIKDNTLVLCFSSHESKNPRPNELILTKFFKDLVNQ